MTNTPNTNRVAQAAATRAAGTRVASARGRVRAGIDALDAGRYSDARRALDQARRTLSASYRDIPADDSTPTTARRRIRAERLECVSQLDTLALALESLDNAYRAETGHDCPAPDHWNLPPVTDGPVSAAADARSAELLNLTVDLFRGDDGAAVVQVDTEPGTGRVRVNVNDAPVFDADPETGVTPDDSELSTTASPEPPNRFDGSAYITAVVPRTEYRVMVTDPDTGESVQLDALTDPGFARVMANLVADGEQDVPAGLFDDARANVPGPFLARWGHLLERWTGPRDTLGIDELASLVLDVHTDVDAIADGVDEYGAYVHSREDETTMRLGRDVVLALAPFLADAVGVASGGTDVTSIVRHRDRAAGVHASPAPDTLATILDDMHDTLRDMSRRGRDVLVPVAEWPRYVGDLMRDLTDCDPEDILSAWSVVELDRRRFYLRDE